MWIMDNIFLFYNTFDGIWYKLSWTLFGRFIFLYVNALIVYFLIIKEASLWKNNWFAINVFDKNSWLKEYKRGLKLNETKFKQISC